MYCKFYGFKENPFNITPDPRFIFLSKNHREAFAHLLFGIQQHSGFIAIIGEVGSGKTTLLRALLNQLGEDTYRTALIFNPCLSAHELLSSINKEYGLSTEESSIAMLLEELNRFLLNENAAGRTVVLIIDEAQNLDPRVLEQIRLISNLETESDKLIQIVLAGQPELARLLEDPQLRQLSQRITVRYQLFPMDYEDTCAYVEHRMELAGGWRAATFEKGAMKRIFRYSAGLPRLINVTCGRALLIGFTQESRSITSRMAAQAIAEISKGGQDPDRPRPWLKPVLIAAALCILTGAAFYSVPHTASNPGRAAEQPMPARQAAPTPPAPQKEAPITAEFTNSLRTGLQKLSETESALKAFNAVCNAWEVKPVAKFAGVVSDRKIERMAAKRGLRATQVNGTIDQLLLGNSPVLLQISVPGVPGYRYLALTEIENARFKVEPPLPSPYATLSAAELRSIWSGKAYLLWKNFLDIPSVSIPGTKGEHVRLLQLLLQKTGNYGGRLNGIFDQGTIEALKTFQSTHGTAADGKLAERTLLLLYRNAGGFSMPALKRKGTRQPA